MSVDYWYLLPVGFGIAVLAMSSGISAGNFWVPVYLLWARLEPPLAFWMTLATMLCGYGSGLVRNLWQGTSETRIILQCLPVVLPGALVGGYLAPSMNVSWLILVFGMFVLGLGLWVLGQALPRSGSRSRSRTSSTRGQWMKARLSPDLQDRGICLLGGLLLGLITVGLGELLLPRLLAGRRSLSASTIVGSAVVVIFVSSLAAALVRLNGPLLAALGEQRATLLGALLFAGPGAILGGQLGPMAARRLNVRALRWYVAIILLAVGILMLVRFSGLVAFAR
ncbi:MAG TPA: sulfite exporter TauE/SafE family protein [Candidatus Tectomicrobia bacterium]|nr:sulfite exporter TauE/SafE family protein [Candidatus Tectomicrobia bacterium]